MAYTVKKLAKLSGVTVRTLHHYDEVNLLKPAYHGRNGYRHYEEEQLLLLQQILFYKRLGFELQKIRTIIKSDDFNKIAALHSHRKALVNDLGKIQELIHTIDNTIEHLQGNKKMKENQFFKGLNSPKQKEYEKYLIDSGKHTAEELETGRKRLEKWSKEEWQEVEAEGEQLMSDYVAAIEKNASVDSLEVHEIVHRHYFKYLKRFGIEVKKEGMAERARFYLGHPDWKKKFDSYHPKLQEFILAAVESYAKS
jgi:DNA-binding transcriptional MerR regulator